MKTIKKKLWVLQQTDGTLEMSSMGSGMPIFYSSKQHAKTFCWCGETPIKVTVTVEQGDE